MQTENTIVRQFIEVLDPAVCDSRQNIMLMHGTFHEPGPFQNYNKDLKIRSYRCVIVM